MSMISGEVFVQKDGVIDHVEYEQHPREFDSPRVHVRFIDDPSVDKCVVQAGSQKPTFFIGTKQLSERVAGVDSEVVDRLRMDTSVDFFRQVNQVAENFRDFAKLDVDSRANCYSEYEAIAQAARQRVNEGNFTVGEAVALFDAFQAQSSTFGQPQESIESHWSGMMA